MTIVAVCEACGAPVLSTQPRCSAHNPIDRSAYIGGGEFDALLKTSGYRPNPVYGTGGEWHAPRMLHLRCAGSDALYLANLTGAELDRILDAA